MRRRRRLAEGAEAAARYATPDVGISLTNAKIAIEISNVYSACKRSRGQPV